MWGAKLEHKRSLPCMCDENLSKEIGDILRAALIAVSPMGLDSSTHRECPLPKYWGSMGISPCPSGTDAVPRLKSWFLLQAGEKKNCLFQPGNLLFKCPIKAVLFRWGRGKCLSGICGNGCVFGHELTLVPPSTTGGEMFSHHPLLAQWYQEQESVQKGQEKHLLWSFLFERHSTGLIAKEREYYIYWKKNAAPSFPSFSFSKWFESLDIFYL